MTLSKTLAAAVFSAATLLSGTIGASVAHAADPAFNPKDLTGIWFQTSGGKFGKYPYTPEYQAEADKRRAAMAAGNPYQPAGSSCLPRGLVGMITTGAYPLEIFQSAREVAVNKENGGMHRIWLNRQHQAPADLTPMFFGDSVGHWEGNVLVVDSISLGANDNIDGQNPHSDALHVVEKYQRTGAATMQVEVTIDDAKALTKPVSTIAYFRLDPTYEMQEYYCVNERNMILGDKQVVAGAK
jgi:hypothetical protein